MKITLAGVTYDHDPNKLLNSDAIKVKRLTGMTVATWQQGLLTDDPEAVKALVWLLKVRAGEDPDWDELDFDHAELIYGDQPDEQQPGPKEDAPGS